MLDFWHPCISDTVPGKIPIATPAWSNLRRVGFGIIFCPNKFVGNPPLSKVRLSGTTKCDPLKAAFQLIAVTDNSLRKTPRDKFRLCFSLITSAITEPESAIVYFKSTRKSGFARITLLYPNSIFRSKESNQRQRHSNYYSIATK